MMRRHPARPGGFTLLELAIVLALLGLALGLVAARIPDLSTARPRVPDGVRSLVAARDSSLRTGLTVHAVVLHNDLPTTVLILPDGRVIGADAMEVDPLTGRSFK